MAHYFVVSSTGSATGDAFTLTGGDDLYLPSNTFIETTSTSGSGISVNSTAGVAIEIAGAVYGGDAISAVNSGTDTSYVFVDPSGIVASRSGTGIYMIGVHQVINRGQVSATGSFGYGILLYGAGAVANYGAIVGVVGIAEGDNTPTETTYTLNCGTITGSRVAYSGSNCTEILVNQGSMYGGVTYGTAAGDILVNSGLMDLTSSNNSNAHIAFNGSSASANDFVINTGTIQETINDSTAAVSMIQFGNGNQNVLRNEGIIYQESRNGSSNAVLLGAGIGDGVQNDAGAKITGNVTAGSGSYQFVVNLGTIEGNVTLGAGMGDVYNAGTTGTIAGGFSINCGAGGDQVYGGAGTTTINGGAGSDTIVASAGGGRMSGGGGSDQLYTSAGAEVFAYAAVSDSNSTSGVDLIHGFRTGMDHIDLTAFHISASAVNVYSSASATALVANVGSQQLTVYFASGNALQASDILF